MLEPEGDLDEEQGRALRYVKQGHNVFLTGEAGTGKSYALRYIIQYLKHKYGGKSVAITAPTGIAAHNIAGQTLHSWAGIGLGDLSIDNYLTDPGLWRETKVLIVDEISMVSLPLAGQFFAPQFLVTESQHRFLGTGVLE